MQTIWEVNRHGIENLCRQFGVNRLEVFGSATGDGFDPGRSDVDLLVRFEPCPPEDHADRYFGLLSALRDLLGREVDLLEIDALSNPYLIREIDATRTLVYAS